MGSTVTGSVATSVSNGITNGKVGEPYGRPRRHITWVHAKGATFNHPAPEVLPGVCPALLAETQALMFPAGVILSALAAKIFYFDVILHSSAPGSFYLGAGVLAAIVMSMIGSLSNLNSIQSIMAMETKTRLILTTVSLSFLLILCLLYLLKISDHFSRAWFALWYVFSVGFLLAARFGILLWARLLRAETRLLQRVAIYGSMDLAARVAEQLFTQDRNLVLTGVFSADAPSLSDEVPAGGMRDLISAAQSGACDWIILAMPSAAKDQILEAIAELEVLPIDVQLCPDAMTFPPEIAGTQGAGGLVLLDLQRPPLNGRGILLKAAMDYVLALIALVVFSPLMLAIAAAIKLNSRGPVFFVQVAPRLQSPRYQGREIQDDDRYRGWAGCDASRAGRQPRDAGGPLLAPDEPRRAAAVIQCATGGAVACRPASPCGRA